MSSSFIKIFLVTSFIALISTHVQANVVDEIEQTFDVNDETSFRLNNINGSVAINGWERSIIKVTATITTDSQEARDNIVIDMLQLSNGVNVETRYKEQGRWKHNNSGKVEYEVMVPNNATLSAIELVNGSLSITNIKGAVSAELVNGSIKAKGLASNSELSSVNGSIKVSYSELAKALDKIDIETVNGSIKISMPKTLNATVKAETMHGSIKTDFGLVAKKNLLTGHHLSGEIGRGDVRITMESVNGSIKLMSD